MTFLYVGLIAVIVLITILSFLEEASLGKLQPPVYSRVAFADEFKPLSLSEKIPELDTTNFILHDFNIAHVSDASKKININYLYVSKGGIFIIDGRSFDGKVLQGSMEDDIWCHKNKKEKIGILNPVRNNYSKLLAVRNILPEAKSIFNVLVIPDGMTTKIKGIDKDSSVIVVNLSDLQKVIKEKEMNIVYTNDQVDDFSKRLLLCK